MRRKSWRVVWFFPLDLRGFPALDGAGEVEMTSPLTSLSRAQGLSLSASNRRHQPQFHHSLLRRTSSNRCSLVFHQFSQLSFHIDDKPLRCPFSVRRSMSLFEEEFFSTNTTKTDYCNNYWPSNNQQFQDISDVITADYSVLQAPEMSMNLEVHFSNQSH